MPLNQDNYRDRFPFGFNKKTQLVGLDSFIKNIEKHFFCRATVHDLSTSNLEANLVIELDCNFDLQETLKYFKKEIWGNFECQKNSFAGLLQQLKQCNDIQINVEEFSLFLNDTSIIINKIYEQSISQQLENVFSKINEHFVHFTKGITEIPYEIYVPVFEGDLVESEHTHLMNINSENNSEQYYFSFWGLYYHSEDEAVVYDLKNQTIIEGNLQMLNR